MSHHSHEDGYRYHENHQDKATVVEEVSNGEAIFIVVEYQEYYGYYTHDWKDAPTIR